MNHTPPPHNFVSLAKMKWRPKLLHAFALQSPHLKTLLFLLNSTLAWSQQFKDSVKSDKWSCHCDVYFTSGVKGHPNWEVGHILLQAGHREGGSCDIGAFISSQQRPICLSRLLTWCVFNALICDGWLRSSTIYLPKVNVNAPAVWKGNENPGCFWNLGDN